MMTMGALSASKARLRKAKHSMVSIWTSSMNRICSGKIKLREKQSENSYLTPGTISAFPSSFHSPTFWLIWSRISCLISPVSPAYETTVSIRQDTNQAKHVQRQCCSLWRVGRRKPFGKLRSNGWSNSGTNIRKSIPRFLELEIASKTRSVSKNGLLFRFYSRRKKLNKRSAHVFPSDCTKSFLEIT